MQSTDSSPTETEVKQIIERLRISTETTSEYDREDHQYDYYTISKIVYQVDGEQEEQILWTETSHSSCHIGGLGGTKHTAIIEGDKIYIKYFDAKNDKLISQKS
eukprot:Awhi_evm1s6469